MSEPFDRWERQHRDKQGPYYCFAGFEADIRAHGDGLCDAYDALDIYDQIQLFAFVCSLLEERDAHPPKPTTGADLLGCLCALAVESFFRWAVEP